MQAMAIKKFLPVVSVEGYGLQTISLLATPTWTRIDDFMGNLAVSTLAQDPSNTQNIYAGTGEGWFKTDAIQGLGIWKSSNGGTSWAQLSSTNNSTFYYIRKLL